MSNVEARKIDAYSDQAEQGKGERRDLSLKVLEERLGADERGLSQEEAEHRLAADGYNEIAEEKSNPFIVFLSHFWGPIPWMIEVAAVLSAVVRHWEDFGIIMTLLVVNGVIGFWEEHQASNTIESLKKSLARSSRVLRGGEWRKIPARELVKGDVIRVRLGDVIPADAKLLEGSPIQVDQSALTGESLPVEAETGDPVYSGSVVKQGEAEAIVFDTGAETFFGRTANLVKAGKNKSHFQQAVVRIGDFLIVSALVLVILILGVALFRGDALLSSLQFALVLTIAAIPVAMPTVLSVTMAIGARILGRKQAIVSHLSSIEELAGMDVLCSDKTGTLTKNQLTIDTPILVDGGTEDSVLLHAALASREEDGDAIDSVIISRYHKSRDEYDVVDFVPFDPVHKRTEATVRSPDGTVFRVIKGAPQVVLEMSENRAEVADDIERAVDDLAHRGYRSLGVARATQTGAPRFEGILPLFDPPRDDAAEVVEDANHLGISVKMITGDQVAIAKETAKGISLGTNILDAGALEDVLRNQPTRSAKLIGDADGFAQVFPEHKYQIVESLQNDGHIVSMTGDGVNDAPALQKADVGIAVSGATDAARSAADIVLMSPGISVIIDAVKEARKIFQRMTSYTIYRIAETIRILLFMTLSILVFNFYPVTAVMIVLLALLNDGAILSIAYDRVDLSPRPEKWDFRSVLGVSSALGITGLIGTFSLFYIADRVFQVPRDMLQTLIYLKLSVAGHLTIFVTRRRGPFWSQRPAWVLLGAVTGTQVIATLLSIYGIFMAPIGWMWAAAVWGYAFIWFLIDDGVKLLAYRLIDEKMPGFFHKRHYAA